MRHWIINEEILAAFLFPDLPWPNPTQQPSNFWVKWRATRTTQCCCWPYWPEMIPRCPRTSSWPPPSTSRTLSNATGWWWVTSSLLPSLILLSSSFLFVHYTFLCIYGVKCMYIETFTIILFTIMQHYFPFLILPPSLLPTPGWRWHQQDQHQWPCCGEAGDCGPYAAFFWGGAAAVITGHLHHRQVWFPPPVVGPHPLHGWEVQVRCVVMCCMCWSV